MKIWPDKLAGLFAGTQETTKWSPEDWLATLRRAQ